MPPPPFFKLANKLNLITLVKKQKQKMWKFKFWMKIIRIYNNNTYKWKDSDVRNVWTDNVSEHANTLAKEWNKTKTINNRKTSVCTLFRKKVRYSLLSTPPPPPKSSQHLLCNKTVLHCYHYLNCFNSGFLRNSFLFVFF